MDHLAKSEKIVIGMIGLPARGKTYLSRKIARYLNWIGVNCRVFNIGQYRRYMYGTKECTADFFDKSNEDACKARAECAETALTDLIEFLNDDGDVAIYDGTNSTAERRRQVKENLDKRLGSYKLMWVESICNDEKIIENNIRMTKISSPDYKEVDSDVATKDFQQRIEKYAETYESLSRENDGEETSFIKLYDVGKEFEMNQISGYILSKIVSFLMNLHITPRPIYFSRHGQSMYNIDDRVGGDSDLSLEGQKYARRLNDFLRSQFEVNDQDSDAPFTKVKVLTSTLRRATTTANTLNLNSKPVYLKLLDELNAGEYDGMTYDEIAERYPLDAKDRKADKLKYRYPRGESYLDVIHRIEPIIFEIERSKIPVIVVGHQAVLRCLYAYFCMYDMKDVPYISIPLHTVIKLVPETYQAREHRFSISTTDDTIKMTDVTKTPFIDDYRSVRT